MNLNPQKKNRVVQLRTARFFSQVTRLYKNTLVVTTLRYAVLNPKRANLLFAEYRFTATSLPECY